MRKAFKKTFQISIGTITAQVITLIALPFLTRIYDPETYGFMAVLILATSLILPLVTLKVESLIFTVYDKQVVRDILSLTRDFLLLMSLGIALIVFLILVCIKQLSLTTSIKYSLFFLLILLAQSLVLLSTQINLYFKNYSNISKSSVIQNAGISFFQITFGQFRPSISSLLAGYVSGKMVGIIPLWKQANATYERSTAAYVAKIRKLKEIITESKNLIIGNTFEIAHTVVPTLLIGSMIGVKYSGYTALIVTILGVPTTFIGGAIASVLLAEFSNLNQAENRNQAAKYLKPFMVLSGLYAFFLITIGENLLKMLLGASWHESVSLVKFLAIPFALNIFWQPLGSFIVKTKKFKWYLILNVLRFSLSLISLTLSFALHLSWVHIVSSYFITSSLVQVVGFYALRRISS